MSLKDDILDIAKADLYSCQYKGEDCWDHGFEEGVDYAIQFINNAGWASPNDIIEIMAEHHIMHDSIPRRSCGMGFAKEIDLKYHIAEMISMCNCGKDEK